MNTGTRPADRRVLVVGGLNTDLTITAEAEPPDDGAARVTSLATSSGGHAGNCAAALAALGCGVSLFAVVGEDPEGDALLAELVRAGVNTSPSVVLPDATTGRVFIPVYPDRRHMLMFRGATDLWDPATCDALDFGAFGAVVLFDPPEPVSRRVLELAVAAGVPVFWNPGGIQAAAPGLLDRVSGARWLAVNRAEYRDLFDGAPDPRHLDETCRARELPSVVVTLGAAGAMAWDGEVVCAGTRRVAVVDPTGAGDAFAAGFVAAHLHHRPWPEPLWWGTAAGAHAVTVPGARVRGLELDHLLTGTPIREVP